MLYLLFGMLEVVVHSYAFHDDVLDTLVYCSLVNEGLMVNRDVSEHGLP